METTDFHSLPRRELQALCKMHKIPANMTNVAMADALVALFAEGAPKEDLAAPQEPKTNMKTLRTTTARQNPSMSKTGRSSRRGPAKGEERKEIDGIPLIELPDTPVVPSGKKTRAREATKTPGRSVVDATGDEKKQEGEEEAAAGLLNSKRASARSMRSRKKVSFALGEDGEGERGFVNEVKKTPVAPRIRAEEEIETGRRGTSRSVSGRATSERRSGRSKAVPKMADLSATEERGDEEEVPISEKKEIVVAEEETSDSVITHEADGHDEERVQSSERIGSEEIPEDVNPTADIAEAVAEDKSDDLLTAGDVTAGEEEASELHPADSKGGDLTVSSAGAPASEDVGDSSLKVSEGADEPVDEAAVRGLDGTAAVDGDDIIVDVPEVQVEPLANCVAGDGNGAIANGEMQEDLDAVMVNPVAEDLDELTFDGEVQENVPGEGMVAHQVIKAAECGKEVDELMEDLKDVPKTAEHPEASCDNDDVDEATEDGAEQDNVLEKPAAETLHEGGCGDELPVDDEEQENVQEDEANHPLPEDAPVVEFANHGEEGGEGNESMMVAKDDVPSGNSGSNEPPTETLPEGGCGDELHVDGEEQENVQEDEANHPLPEDAHPVVEAADHGEEGGEGNEPMEVAEEDVPSDNSGSNEPPIETLPEGGCGDELPVDGEEQENVQEDEANHPLPEDAHPVVEAADHGEEGGEGNEPMVVAEEDVSSGNSGSNEPPTETLPEGGCDDELPVDGEEQENVQKDEANHPLPQDAHPVVKAADHGEEGGEGNEPMEVAEEDVPSDNSGSNEPPIETLPEGGCGDELPVDGEEQENVQEDEANHPLPEDAHPVVEAADHGEEGGEGNEPMVVAEEDVSSGNSGSNEPPTETLPEGGCDDELPVDGEEQENVQKDEANHPLPQDAHPVVKAADHGEEGGEGNEPTEVAGEDVPADNSGSNEPSTEAAGEGGITVENTDVIPVAETGSEELTVTVREAASCDNPSVVELTLACDVSPIVEAALRDVEQIVEAAGSDGSTGNVPVEEASLPEELPENPEVSNVELEHDELLPVTEEQIPSNTEPVEEVPELIQELPVPAQCADNVAPLLASCIVAETPEAPIEDEPNTTVEATPTKFAAVEAPCSAKKSALSRKEAGVSDNKENSVVILYSSSKQPVAKYGTENKKKKNGLPTQAELEKMSLRQLRKQLEALSVHDSNHKRHEHDMVLVSGKKAERKRTALAALPDNCLKSPQ